MLAKVRSFFADQRVIEVDTPVLSTSAPIDSQIDVMTVVFACQQKGYLHTSPEYAMKRLLCHYPVDMYQLSHVFREGEAGPMHNPEFTMIEWYRMGYTLFALIEETIRLIELFLGPQLPTILTYQQLFLQFVGFDPFDVTASQILQISQEAGLDVSPSAPSWDIDTWLYYYMGCVIEPKMQELYVIHSFPASQSSLATTAYENDQLVARRFEIFFNGIELANGFEELQNPTELRSRFEKSNQDRYHLGKKLLPIDEHFLSALEKGLPPCCGVAAGFDRLLMLMAKARSIKDVLPLSWDLV